MKLILNNETNKAILCSSVARNLDLADESVDFQLIVNMGEPSNTGKYFAPYAKSPIVAITVLDNSDNMVMETGTVVARLNSFNESFSDNYYSGQASISILAPSNEE